jgi:hypothetical protein
MIESVQEQLVVSTIRTALSRIRSSHERGVIDPEYPASGFANPRYQEICLALAVAVKLRISLPEEVMDVDLEAAAAMALDGWLSLLGRNGWVRSEPGGPPDAQATAYGAFAVSRTLILLGDLVPALIRSRARKTLKRTARYLVKSSIPDGIETKPLRFAALGSLADWLENKSLAKTADKIHKHALRDIEKELDNRGYNSLDAGSLAFALSYLALMVREPDDHELEIWKRMTQRCLISTMPNGIFGGGAETSIACLPITTGFEIIADKVPEAAEMANRLNSGWELHLYDSVMDNDIPWLTPMSYLVALGLVAKRGFDTKPGETLNPATGIGDIGDGLIELGDWLIRLGPGGTIGWAYHKPSGSSRIIGSPSGLALREGPWIIQGNYFYQPSFAGVFPSISRDPVEITGSLVPVPIPATERPLRGIGFPRSKGKEIMRENRLVPPYKPPQRVRADSLDYKREIEVTSEGALRIETHLKGKNSHRLPVVWPGGMLGELKIDKEPYPSEKQFHARHVREIAVSGTPWPTWTVRFDRPVDLLYDVIHIPVQVHPMRYMSAASGTFDFIVEDRFQMTWRVG